MLTHLQIERWLPIALGILSGVVCWLWGMTISHWIAKEALSALLSAAAICAGFLTTALSILMTLGSTAIGKQIRRRGKLPHLFSYLREAIYGCLCLCSVCLLAFFQIAEHVGSIPIWSSALVMGFLAHCAFAMWRIVRILSRVVQAMSAPEDSPEKIALGRQTGLR